MTILSGSRYSDDSSIEVSVPDITGVYQLSVLRTIPRIGQSFNLYVWQVGDRPDLVAQEMLGDPTLWWAIFDINPEVIDPFNIPPGSIVRVPNAPPSGLGTLIQ